MLSSLTKFKNFLGIDENDTSKDNFLNDILLKAEEKIGKVYFGGKLQKDAYEEYHRFSRIIYPVHYPVLNLIELKVDDTLQMIEKDFYLINSQIIFTHSYSNESIVSIVYEAGFDVLPMDVEIAVFLMASKYLKVMQSVDFNKDVIDVLDMDIEEILTPYRRYVI
ncbi:MAG: phage head-tail connector protein [Candidatus Bilamarchaeaceae archaeon]